MLHAGCFYKVIKPSFAFSFFPLNTLVLHGKVQKSGKELYFIVMIFVAFAHVFLNAQ